MVLPWGPGLSWFMACMAHILVKQILQVKHDGQMQFSFYKTGPTSELRCSSCHNGTFTIILLTDKDGRPDMSFHQSLHNDKLVMMTLTLVQITQMIRRFALIHSI